MALWGRSRIDDRAVVLIHQDLVDLSSKLVEENPGVEVGGKFVGFILEPDSDPPPSAYGHKLKKHWDELTKTKRILIVGSLSSGPQAEASGSHLMPDGDFQAATYLRLNRSEPWLEHLGSWHSHHPNRLRDFSQADRIGYTRTVSNPEYEPNIFLAGLCYDHSGLGDGIFEIYKKSSPTFQSRLAGKAVQIVDGFPSLQKEIAEAEKVDPGSDSTIQADANIVATEALNRSVQEVFPGQVQRVTDHESVSWIVATDDLEMVMTYPGGAVESTGLSIKVQTDGAELILESIGAPGDWKKLRKLMKGAITQAEQLIAKAGGTEHGDS